MRRSIAALFALALIAGACAAPEMGTSPTTIPSCPPPPTLHAGETFNAPPGACYTLGARAVVVPANVTINGGTWYDPNTYSGKQHKNTPRQKGRPAFLVAAPGVTLENLSIYGHNKGGAYLGRLAFNAGISLVGSLDTTLIDVSVHATFGDCLELAPRRDPKTERITSPVRDLISTDLNIGGCGRQGISPISVHGATFTNTTIGATAYDSVDIEADQANGEGAKDLTFDGAHWSGIFSIKAGGSAIGPITVENLTMGTPTGGEALYVKNLNGKPDAGLINFNDDHITCGESAYVACLEIGGPAAVDLSNTTIHVGYKGFDGREPLFHAGRGVALGFENVTASGDYKPGTLDGTAAVFGAVHP